MAEQRVRKAYLDETTSVVVSSARFVLPVFDCVEYIPGENAISVARWLVRKGSIGDVKFMVGEDDKLYLTNFDGSQLGRSWIGYGQPPRSSEGDRPRLLTISVDDKIVTDTAGFGVEWY